MTRKINLCESTCVSYILKFLTFLLFWLLFLDYLFNFQEFLRSFIGYTCHRFKFLIFIWVRSFATWIITKNLELWSVLFLRLKWILKFAKNLSFLPEKLPLSKQTTSFIHLPSLIFTIWMVHMNLVLSPCGLNFFLSINPKLLLLHKIESVDVLGDFSLDSHYLAQVVVC